ncbi:MAG: hypothetical protein KJ626_07770 [Verrucomicrobia bacterium]|nr:hypothetical protein [Verrucomicrobiota bacterium]
MPKLLNKTIRLFLDSIGRREEYEFYLEKFHGGQTAAFAIVCPERAGFEEVVSVFNFDIEFLLQVGLFPVILLTGEDAEGMRELLTAAEHPYSIMSIAGSEVDVQKVADFVADAKAKQQATVLVAPSLARAEMLPGLIPATAKRVHIIRGAGALRNRGGEHIQYYYAAKTDPAELAEDDRALALEVRDLLGLRPGIHISVASPWNLLQELFTVRGAGCIVRRGSHILRIQGKEELDRGRLAALFEESFKKKMASEAFLDSVVEGFVEENYRGAALLERHDSGVYLSKFAVGTEARGEGLANELWREIVAQHPSIFWRARPDNPINHWYEKQADGSHRAEKWRIFWKGIEPDHLPGVIAYAMSREDDFEPS